jgi:glutamate 5-kinase
MITKLIAAELACSVGIKTIITNGSNPNRIPLILQDLVEHKEAPSNELLYTVFVPHPSSKPLSDRKWWILHSLKPQGTLYLDAGAIVAIGKHNSSLFAAGVVDVTGKFERDQTVRLVTKTVEHDEAGGEVEKEVEIGKGLVNYSSVEMALIKGCKSSQIQEALGYADSDSIVHRDNLAILPSFRTEDDFLQLWEKVKWRGKEYTPSEMSL